MTTGDTQQSGAGEEEDEVVVDRILNSFEETRRQEDTQSDESAGGDSTESGLPGGSPVGSGDYEVAPGDCMASIAFTHGFFWETLWQLPENAELREARQSPNALLPGDRVTIPELRRREESGDTEARHRFRRRGVPEELRLRLLDEEGEGRAGERVVIEIEGTQHETETDSNGEFRVPISPDATQGTLRVPSTGEDYPLRLGHLDPSDSLSGIQARLTNLGFACGRADGESGPLTRGALRRFQASQGLSVTGEPDEETRSALADAHGS